MLKRTVILSERNRVYLSSQQLCVENQETGKIHRVPAEDLGVLIVEDQRTSISVPALNILTENNCAVVFCDGKHMPVSMLMPLDSNSIQGERYRLQMEVSASKKKELWRQIVKAKIRNQSRLLDKLGLDGRALKPFYMNVKSGDGDNREGVAANVYWDIMFGRKFVRTRYGGNPNPLLNYGYTILRAGMARAIMGTGLYPAFGLFHKNRYNAFPLADDLMEPYRPYVDYIVYELCLENKLELDIESRRRLNHVMFLDTSFGSLTRPLEIGLSLTTASFSRCLAGEEKMIVFPAL